MSLARVELRRVSKVYGGRRVLSAVDLTLVAGEVVALLGPNGAGKSTLVGIASTLLRPTSGAMLLDGAEPGPAHRGEIGLLGHEPMCYGELSATENLGLFARLHRLSDPAIAGNMLARVGLDPSSPTPTRAYSRGMLQRLAIARALLHRPSVLLLDEPFSSLDAEGIVLLRSLLTEARERGAMIVIVSHDLEPLPGLATRLLVLRRGRFVLDCPAPAELTALRQAYAAAVDSTQGIAA